MNGAGKDPSIQGGHVLCIAGWWPDENGVAGIFIKEHVRAIARERPVTVVYAEVHKGGIGWPRMVSSFAYEDGLPVHRIRIDTPIRRFKVADRLVRSAYRKLINRLHRECGFDLIHVHVRTEVTSQVLDIASIMDLPVVVTEHNSYYHLGINTLPRREQWAQRKAIAKWFDHPNIKAVLPVSHDLAKVLCNDFGVDQSIISVIPNIANAVFKPAIKPGSPPFRIVLAAVWRPPKDHDVFIDAMALIPLAMRHRCQVDWVGYGPNMDVIRSRCSKELTGVDIRFHGMLLKSDLAVLMQKAHLFVLPTTADNLPCVVIESLCCGTPVLSMNVNGLPELVDGSNGILVPASDPDILAQALMQCINDGDRFRTEDIARDAQLKFSEDAVAERIEQVYTRVLLASGH